MKVKTQAVIAVIAFWLYIAACIATHGKLAVLSMVLIVVAVCSVVIYALVKDICK